LRIGAGRKEYVPSRGFDFRSFQNVFADQQARLPQFPRLLKMFSQRLVWSDSQARVLALCLPYSWSGNVLHETGIVLRESKHKNSEVADRSVQERSLWRSAVQVRVFESVPSSALLKLESGRNLAPEPDRRSAQKFLKQSPCGVDGELVERDTPGIPTQRGCVIVSCCYDWRNRRIGNGPEYCSFWWDHN
jgi:hypothetical protein